MLGDDPKTDLAWLVANPGKEMSAYHDSGSCWQLINGATASIRALESDLATAIKERDAAVAAGKVLARAMADLSGLVNCADWCPARDGGECRCGNERDHQAIIDAANTNPLALEWVKAAQEASNGTN